MRRQRKNGDIKNGENKYKNNFNDNLNPNIPTITLNVSCQNTLIKRERLPEWI